MTDLVEVVMEANEDTLTGRYLTFLIGKEVYGIEIRYVTEIVGIQEITEIPEMPEYMKGIINLRGKIVPLMDIRLRFTKEPKDYDERTCVIVIDFSGILTGLIVDSVSEVLALPAESVVELLQNSVGMNNKYVKNIGKDGSDVVLLLECEKLLVDEQINV